MSLSSLNGILINRKFLEYYKIDLHLSVSKIDKIEELLEKYNIHINRMKGLQIKHHTHILYMDKKIQELQKECYQNNKTIKKLIEKNSKLENSNLQLMQFYTTLQEQCNRYLMTHEEILYKLEELTKKMNTLETKYQELEKYRIDYVFAMEELKNKIFNESESNF